MIKTLTTSVLALGLLASNANANMFKNTPFDQDTWSNTEREVRNGKYTPRVNTQRKRTFDVHIKNTRGETVWVAVKYKTRYTGKWVTLVWKLSPYDKAYVLDTDNRYVFVGVSNRSHSSAKRMVNSSSRRHKINMGSSFTKYTIRV